MFVPMHRNVHEASVDVLRLSPNIENQICNAFKNGRGQDLNQMIALHTSVGDRFINQIRSLSWAGPATLIIEGTVISVQMSSYKDCHLRGEAVHLELDLRAKQRNGEMAVLNRFTY